MAKKKSQKADPRKAVLEALDPGKALMVLEQLKLLKIHSLPEARVFLTLAKNGPLGVSGLSQALKMPISTASRIAWALHEADLLKLTTDATDRRLRLYAVA